MRNDDRFDSLIKKYASEHRLPWLLIKAQIWAESGFNPAAQSACGAKGLMQLMPETDFAIDGHADGFDPEGNISDGVRYDRWLYDRFPEIPKADERLQFMLAAYNCGRGYINAALRLARECEFGYQGKALRAGDWQFWSYAKSFLAVPGCRVKGHAPDFCQVWDYVEKVWKKYQQYKGEATEVGVYPPDHTARNDRK